MGQIKIQVGDAWWMLLIPRRRLPFLVGQLVALGCVVLSVALWFLLRSVLLGAPFITFFPFIVVATAWGGRAGGATLMACGVIFAIVVWLTIRQVGLSSALVSSSVFILFGALTVGIIHAMQVLLTALETAEQQSEVLAREMRHRVGNIMQLVQAIAQMTARSCSDLSEFMPRFEGRMRALSEAHRMSSGENAMPNDLETMLRILLSAYDPERVRLIGPACRLDADTAPRVALVIHELATNAAKYGALSANDGQIRVAWEIVREASAQGHEAAGPIDFLHIRWRERGGPALSPDSEHKSGFGSTLMRRLITAMGGHAEVVYAPDGAEISVSLPVSALQQS